MTQAAKIRDALPAGTELNRDGMLDATGIPAGKLDGVLYAFVARKEVLTRQKDGETHYRINPDYKRGAGGGEVKTHKGKKPAGKRKVKRAKKAARKKSARRPYRRIAKRHAAHPATNGAALEALALDNLLHAAKDLRASIATALDTPETTIRAVENYDRAERLHTAATA